MSVLRPALTLALLLTGASARAQELSCQMVLFACDIGRNGTAECPVEQTADVRLYAEGDSWNLIVNPLATGGTNDPRPDVVLGVMSAAGAEDGTRFYFIAGQDGLDGAFTYAPTGAARLQLFRSGSTYGLEDYFQGTCTEVTE